MIRFTRCKAQTLSGGENLITGLVLIDGGCPAIFVARKLRVAIGFQNNVFLMLRSFIVWIERLTSSRHGRATNANAPWRHANR